MNERGHPIVVAWRTLAVHAAACEVCRPGVKQLVRPPWMPRVDFEVYDGLCPVGQELFTTWRGGKDAWLETMRPVAERRFMFDRQLWDDGVTADQRAAAVMSMPEDDYRAWLALPDDRRHAQLRALERTFSAATTERRPGPGDQPGSRGTGDGPPARRSTCAGCGKPIPPRAGPFCSRACRQQYGGRPSLEPTE